MISFNSTLAALLREPTLEVFYLIEIKIDPVYRTTSFYSDITMTDGSLYKSDGRIISTEPPQLSTTVDKSQYSIVFADPLMEFRQYFDNLTGKLVTVRLGFVDQKTSKPLLDIDNTLLVYRGAIDNFGYSINTNEIGSVVLNLTCASPMSDLDMKKALYTSREALTQISMEDTSFNQIYDDEGQIALKWGKI